MKKIFENRTGITLIALVITIVVLLILAGVSINTLFGDNGIITSATKAGNKYKMQAIKDQIEVSKTNWELERVMDNTKTIGDFWETLEKAKLINDKEADVELIENNTEDGNAITKYQITTTEGYLVEIVLTEKATGATITVGDIEESTSPLPRIVVKELTSTSSSITIKVEVSKIENGEITYLYKLATSETWSDPVKMTGMEATITGLETGKLYDIRIVAKNENGSKSVDKTMATGDDIAPQEPTVTFSGTTVEINKEMTATVTLKDNESGIDVSKSKWIFNQTSTAIGTAESNYANTFTSETETIKLTPTASGNWYLHILSTDNAGNVIETIKGAVRVSTTWSQSKTTVTNGVTTYTVGDNYSYNCGVSGYTGSWKVLGAENGKLLIMSTADIGTLKLEGKDGYNTGISKLNEMCKAYGTNARSIKVEDINRVTGYDPNNTGDGKKFYVGQWLEYGSSVTYTASKTTNNTNGLTYTGGLSNGKYEHVDGRIIGSNGVTSITETSTYYYYYPYSLTTSNATTGTCKGISTTSKAYELIFGTYANTSAGKGNYYWLASSYVYAYSNYSCFGLRFVGTSGHVYNYCHLWGSYGYTSSPGLGVRAVVSL